MKLYHRLFIFATACIMAGTNIHAQASAAYQMDIDNWNAQRIKALKADDGWLNLVGLYWLQEGRNSFGSGSKNQLVFPSGSISEAAGYFERAGNTVKLVVENNTAISVNGSPVNGEAIIFKEGAQKPAIVTSGNLQWTIIKRDDKIGVRLRDLKSPLASSFNGVERFPVDSAWRVTAKLQTQSQSANIYITNIIGQTDPQQSPGKLVFMINNHQYTLDALEEGDELFIIFGDATSGKTTYPSGRFLYAKKPGADGVTVLDFNKAFDPPCAFTNYATCPLPPKQNILPIAITAGEKNYGHH